MVKRVLVVWVGFAFLVAATISFGIAGQERKHSDEHFVATTSAGNLAEIEYGKLAEEKAGSREVKDFGRQMVTDHSKANQDLAMIAKKQGFKVASMMTKEHHDVHMKLQALQGAEFDRHYIMHMVDNHQKSVKLYQTQATSGTNRDLKAFAAKTLPTVEKHLKMARSLSEKLKGGGR